MSTSIPPSSSSDTKNQELRSPFQSFDSLVVRQPTSVWRQRLDRALRPKVALSTFLAISAFYCFVIGRDRYTSVSEFVIQQAAPLQGGSASVLAGAAAAPRS